MSLNTLIANPAAVRIENAETSYSHYEFRTPMKFGGMVLDKLTVLDVRCTITRRDGRSVQGFGSMPLANTWAFPSRAMPYERTLHAMVQLAERCAGICGAHWEFGDPLQLGMALEKRFLAAAKEITQELGLAEPLPKLATLVAGSAFDAALHDAFGKAHGLNCYHTYTSDFLAYDLSAYLGSEYKGKWPADYLYREPQKRMALYHLAGALDPLTDADVVRPVADGLPETLPQWIDWNGLTHIKIKLNGDDLDWDLERVLAIERVTTETQRRRGVESWHYSLDFNERCTHVDYLIEMLRKLRERAPECFERVQYIEQPTARDLAAHPHNRMHEAAKIRPVVIDESLTDLESLLLARELGYTGAALKACKGQSQSLLMAAAAQHMGMFLCVQDLACPGASLIHSAGLAAHVPGVVAVESNSRQYCPQANRGWEDRFPGIFKVRDGVMDTSCLDGLGLGACPPET